MSQFEGGKSRVRCVDCTKLSGTQCSAKGTKVSPKKRRVCPSYEFKGEYTNRVPADAVYMPHMDSKTRKMIKRLLKMGVIPVADDGSVDMRDGFARTKTLPMPATTATASLVGAQTQEDPLIYQPSSSEITDPKLIWTPNSGDENDDVEPEDNRD